MEPHGSRKHRKLKSRRRSNTRLTLEILEDRTTPSLVAAFGFNEGSGLAVADVSGNNNNGAISGATWSVAGKYGGALSFDGVNDWVTIADAASLDLTNGMTLEAWVNPTTINGWETVILKEGSGELAYALYADNNGNDIGGPRRPGTWIRQGGASYFTLGTAQVPLNQWTHLAATYDGSVLRLYVNATQAGSVSRTGAITTSTNALRIGGNTVWGEYFNGLLDEIRVYNRALTATEIQADMNTPVDGADTTAPTVSVTSPANGATVSGSITVTANASDNVGVAGVQFLLDGANLGAEDTSAPYSVSWNTLTASEGSHTLTARARDAAGNTTTSTQVSVTVSNADTTAPTVAITSPSAGSTITGTATVSANASDNVGVAGVQFLLDGVNLGAEDTAAPYTVSWDTTVATAGTHTISARARDAAGNTGLADEITVTVVPQLIITLPTEGATVTGSTVNITYTTAGDLTGVDHIHFRLDNGAERMDLTLDGVHQLTNVPVGTHQLDGFLVRADHSKIAGTDAVPVTFSVVVPDTTPPDVVVTSPANGATVAGNVTINANASDNVGVTGVQFLLDGNNVGAEDIAAPFSISWNTATATNGTHTLAALARDAAGNTTTSALVTVTVANAQPPGLVAAYGFGEGAGLSVADSSGNANNGTIAGAAWNSGGRFGNALSFDGVNDWVTVPDANSLDLTTGMTLEAWVKPSALANWRTVLMKEIPGELAYNLYANEDVSRPSTWVRIGTTSSAATGSTALALNAWTHLASTYDGANLRLYVNGAQVGSRALTGSVVTSTSPLRLGGNAVWGEYFNGLIDEVRIYNRALSQAEIQSDMNTPVPDPAPPDTTPPTVSIISPIAGATVAGTVSISADAADNVGVVGVQFLLDGANLGVEDNSFPYSVSWDTVPGINGTHTLQARARDLAGNTTTSTLVTVTVDNSTDPSQIGAWSGPSSWPLVTTHIVLLHTGEILAWEGEFSGGNDAGHLWNPQTQTFTPAPNPFENIFCAAHVALADGRILVVGGHDSENGLLGERAVHIFDPATRSWSLVAPMAYRRWYPTATTLPDGRVLVTSGSEFDLAVNVPIPEVYDPVANTWTQLSSAVLSIPNYPHMFVLPDGRVLQSGSVEETTPTRVLDIAAQTWTTIDPVVLDGGSAVMYAPGKVLKSGSASNTNPADPSAATAYVLDMNQSTPVWQPVDSMAHPRTYHDLTVLPDGSVLATGGATRKDGLDNAFAVYQAELWSPVTETWSRLASMQTPRLYHSTALLLPDGRVLVSGGGRIGGGADQLNAEIYSPPYLFRGSRPTITSAPTTIPYGSSFFVETPNAASISSVSIIRPGAVTHGFDEDQRFMNLTFEQVDGGLSVQAPANGNLAPPGYYMLWIVNTNGVPSVSSFVRFPAPWEDFQPPTAPGNFNAAGSVAVADLSWSASSDNVAVTRYNVHRSTTPNFIPSGSNRVAQVTGISFTDSGLAAGTYYYRVTAEDAAGNVSPSSTEASATVSADSAAPTVQVTNPTNGATVSGVLAVTANASDNVGVAGVQFLLDGANLGAEDTAFPYSVSWTTNTAANGAHVLTARARDAAGNITTSAAVNVTVSNAVPTGLVLALGFNEASGATVTDVSGAGNHGTISGATRTASGRFGGALSFDGVNDLVNIADAASLDLTTGMTLEAWVSIATINGWETVILKEASGDLAYAVYADNNGNDVGGPRRPAAWIRQGSASYGTAGTSQLAVNNWTHLASTYDGAALRLFVNGVQVSSLARTGSLLVTANPLRIGGNNIWSEWFNGLIDEVRIYNRALTAAEITTDMNTPIGGGLRLDFPPGVPGPHTEPLTEAMMAPVLTEAIARWVATGSASETALETIPVQIADLPGDQLGFASMSAIWIDRDAAGYGWYVDPTPGEDSEFAASHGPAYGKADLLTVLAHELGHALGLEHSEPGDHDLMDESLTLGVRRLPTDELMAHPLASGMAQTTLSQLPDVALVQPAKAEVSVGQSHPAKKRGGKPHLPNSHVSKQTTASRSHKLAHSAATQQLKTRSLFHRIFAKLFPGWSRGAKEAMIHKSTNRP